LKWLTLALFAYVAVLLTIQVPWRQVGIETLQPWAFIDKTKAWKDYAAMVVAVLGTTISPYLFFWQSAQEVEDNNRRPDAAALHKHPEYVAEHLARIKQDTFIGMIFSNLIAICIVVATAVTLNLQGITDIQTSAQAALALKPVAGEFAFIVFALGIVGTGLLAVPVLAGSAAYAVSEVFSWTTGLSHRFNEAPGFYLMIILATGIGSLLSYFEVDPIQTLIWSAILNGIISVPIMAAMMWIGQSKRLMSAQTISAGHRWFGWTATAVMAVAVVMMFATL
jgi:Mn2+/Fe2+ NRAMP family transporter